MRSSLLLFAACLTMLSGWGNAALATSGAPSTPASSASSPPVPTPLQPAPAIPPLKLPPPLPLYVPPPRMPLLASPTYQPVAPRPAPTPGPAAKASAAPQNQIEAKETAAASAESLTRKLASTKIAKSAAQKAACAKVTFKSTKITLSHGAQRLSLKASGGAPSGCLQAVQSSVDWATAGLSGNNGLSIEVQANPHEEARQGDAFIALPGNSIRIELLQSGNPAEFFPIQ